MKDEDGVKVPVPRATRQRIARYWLLTPEGRGRYPTNPALGDTYEPVCFACGWWSNSWSAGKTFGEVWDNADTLERAHLTPNSLGGGGGPDNLALLCEPCHLAAPDHRDPLYMLEWMRLRPIDGHHRLVSRAREAADMVTAAGITSQQVARMLGSAAARRQWSAYATAMLGSHAGICSPASMAAAIMSYTRDTCEVPATVGVGRSTLYRWLTPNDSEETA